MKIAIFGRGNVGGTLGRRWGEFGHEIVYGVRNPLDPVARSEVYQEGAQLVGFAEAAAGADVVLLAVPWAAVPEVLAQAGNLSGKVLLDAVNPLTPDLQGLVLGTTTSAAEEIARLAAGARVVKIFNTTGSGNMADPRYPGGGATMLVAGDDAGAKAVAADLARVLGFEPIDLGGLTEARRLEPLALIWIRLAYGCGLGPDFVLNVVRR